MSWTSASLDTTCEEVPRIFFDSSVWECFEKVAEIES